MTSSTLPVLAFAEAIKKAVATHDVTIIKADTGAGKSTQVPQILFEAGYSVVVTEPRRLAARTLAERVAEEMEVTLGELVGYQTAFDRMYSKSTEILFCTDGLHLVRTLFGEYKGGKTQVLIIDEAHEWNLNIETLVAWTKKEIQRGWKTKLVVMSATFEVEELRTFFATAGSVAIVDVPGRVFPVTMHQEPYKTLLEVTLEFTLARRNILVFLPGKKEIHDFIDELNEVFARNGLLKQRVVFPLYGELSVEEQKKCFKNYSIPKIIVSTNVAQTSVTIDDLDVVIDSGKERRAEVENGVEGLFLRNISRMDCLQRKGRAGRTKKGDYVLCAYATLDDRKEYAVPEIQRSLLDQVVLRLAAISLDAEELEFFHQPLSSEIIIAKESLEALGALKNNIITDMGRCMAKIPLSCRFARMLIEAEKLHVVDDVLAITVILEIGSLLDYKNGGAYNKHVQEKESDLLAELKIWNLFKDNRNIDFEKEGLSARSFFKIREMLNKLNTSLQDILVFGSTGDEKDILMACVSGMIELLYKTNRYHECTNGKEFRKFNDKSCVKQASWVVGFPKTIEFKDNRGNNHILELLNMLTKVELQQIIDLAPHLFLVKENLFPFYSDMMRQWFSTKEIYYKGELLITEEEPITDKALIEEKEKERIEKIKNREDAYLEMNRRREIENAPDKDFIYDGKTFPVISGYYKPCLQMTREEVFTLGISSLRMTNGVFLSIHCEGLEANSLTAMKEQLRAEDEKRSWKDAKERYHTDFTNKWEVMFKWFDDTPLSFHGLRYPKEFGEILLVPDEYFYVSDKKYGYICLQREQKKVRRTILPEKEKALAMTQTAIEFLFDRYIRETYPEEAFKTKTKEGKEAYTFFNEVVEEVRKRLYENVNTFMSVRNELSEMFTEIEREYLKVA